MPKQSNTTERVMPHGRELAHNEPMQPHDHDFPDDASIGTVWQCYCLHIAKRTPTQWGWENVYWSDGTWLTYEEQAAAQKSKREAAEAAQRAAKETLRTQILDVLSEVLPTAPTEVMVDTKGRKWWR